MQLVGHLQLKFPDIDPTRLGELLRLVALDANKAHAVLKATIEREALGSVQVCRHYLAGDCRRADCMVGKRAAFLRICILEKTRLTFLRCC